MRKPQCLPALALPRIGALAVALASLVALSPAPAAAQTTAESQCRDTIAQQFERYTAAVARVVIRCNQRRSSGEGEIGGDCYVIDEADTELELPPLRDEARNVIFATCTGAEDLIWSNYVECPAPASDADDLGLTTGIDDFVEVADCVVALVEAHMTEMLSDAQGTPDGVLLRPGWRCQRKLGTGATRLAATYLAESRRCQELEDFAFGGLLYSCDRVDPRIRILKVESRFGSRVPKACTNEDVAALNACASDVPGVIDCAELSAENHGAEMIHRAYMFQDVLGTTTTTTTTTTLLMP